MYSFFAQKWYGLLSFWALSWLQARTSALVSCWLIYGGCGWCRGGGVLVSNNCFLQQNTTASLLELYFNDLMQTVYARGGGGGGGIQQREVADWADVVFTDTVGLRLTTTDNRQHWPYLAVCTGQMPTSAGHNYCLIHSLHLRII